MLSVVQVVHFGRPPPCLLSAKACFVNLRRNRLSDRRQCLNDMRCSWIYKKIRKIINILWTVLLNYVEIFIFCVEYMKFNVDKIVRILDQISSSYVDF